MRIGRRGEGGGGREEGLIFLGRRKKEEEEGGGGGGFKRKERREILIFSRFSKNGCRRSRFSSIRFCFLKRSPFIRVTKGEERSEES